MKHLTNGTASLVLLVLLGMTILVSTGEARVVLRPGAPQYQRAPSNHEFLLEGGLAEPGDELKGDFWTTEQGMGAGAVRVQHCLPDVAHCRLLEPGFVRGRFEFETAMHLIADIAIIPLGVGNSLSSSVAACERVFTEAGLDPSISPHTLRHSFATHLIQGGADIRHIQALLFFNDTATTEIYTRVATADLRGVIRKSHPRERTRRVFSPPYSDTKAAQSLKKSATG